MDENFIQNARTSFNEITNSSWADVSNYTNICPPLSIPSLIITSGIVATLIITGNVMVIVAIAGGSARFSRPMYWFIIHLSFSDFLIGLMLLWNFCLASIFRINNSLTSLSILQGIWVTSTCSSTFGILFLAADRYMQVVHKDLHSRYFTRCSVGCAIMLAWLLPALVFLIAPLAFNWSCLQLCKCHELRYMECKPFAKCSLVIPPLTKSQILIGVIYLHVMLPWPILFYTLIFIKARKSTHHLRRHISHRDIRLIHTLAVIMFVFLLTLAPTGVVMILDYLTNTHDTKLVDFAVFVFVIAALNSLANPILYMWRIPAIRKSLHKKFYCCFKKRFVEMEGYTTRNMHRDDTYIGTSNQLTPPGNQYGSNYYKQRFFGFQDNNEINSSDESDTSSPLFQKSQYKKRQSNLELNPIKDRHPVTAAHSSPLCGDARIVHEGKSYRIHHERHGVHQL